MANAIREQRTRGVQSVDHALAILTAFQADTPLLGPTDLSQRLGLSKSAIHALLASLERAGFVIRDEQLGKYALGPRLLHLASLRLEHTAIRPLAIAEARAGTITTIPDMVLLCTQPTRRVLSQTPGCTW